MIKKRYSWLVGWVIALRAYFSGKYSKRIWKLLVKQRSFWIPPEEKLRLHMEACKRIRNRDPLVMPKDNGV